MITQVLKSTVVVIMSIVIANMKLIIEAEFPKSGYLSSAIDAMKVEGKKSISII